MKRSLKYFDNNEGSLLLEMLVVIGVVAIIGSMTAQLVFASLKSGRFSTDEGDATFLADEAMTAVQAAAFEQWQYVYLPPDGTGDAVTGKGSTNHYRPVQVGGAWRLTGGDETIVLGNSSFTRYFTVSNVCRDNTTRDIAACGAGAGDDPSTQEITVTVGWNGGSMNRSAYITRWQNQICSQSSWTGVGTGTTTCSTTEYDSKAAIDLTTTPGSVMLQAQ